LIVVTPALAGALHWPGARHAALHAPDSAQCASVAYDETQNASCPPALRALAALAGPFVISHFS
jgi:hypothetical protein